MAQAYCKQVPVANHCSNVPSGPRSIKMEWLNWDYRKHVFGN